MTPREWARDAAHREHVVVCACGQPYDANVDRATGEHRTRGRRARYCSDACQNRYEYERRKDAVRQDIYRREYLADSYSSALFDVMREVHLLLARPGGWGKLYASQWDLLRAWAPDVAELLRFHEDATRSERISIAWVRRNGYEAAERLRDEAVAAIQQWFHRYDEFHQTRQEKAS